MNQMEVRHGYTLAELDGLARYAVAADRLMAMSATERFDIAWSAIALRLCEDETAPSRSELVQAGWQAIARHVRDGLRQRGYRDGTRDWSSAQPTMPRFVQFWGSPVTPSPEDGVVERLATRQVMTVLSGRYRDAIVALAVHDDYMAAAAALGINYKAFGMRIASARRAINRVWHEGETPRQVRRTDRRVEVHGQEPASCCRQGHEYTPENTYWRHRMLRGKPHRARVCRECEASRSRVRVAARAALRDGGTE